MKTVFIQQSERLSRYHPTCPNPPSSQYRQLTVTLAFAVRSLCSRTQLKGGCCQGNSVVVVYAQRIHTELDDPTWTSIRVRVYMPGFVLYLNIIPQSTIIRAARPSPLNSTAQERVHLSSLPSAARYSTAHEWPMDRQKINASRENQGFHSMRREKTSGSSQMSQLLRYQEYERICKRTA